MTWGWCHGGVLVQLSIVNLAGMGGPVDEQAANYRTGFVVSLISRDRARTCPPLV